LPFTINKEIEIALLFFGFPGCTTICIPSVDEMDTVYEQLTKSEQLKTGLYFINLTPLTPSQAMLDSLSKHFHGIDLQKTELDRFTYTLGAYQSAPLTQDGELSHSGFLYLLKHKNVEWHQLCTYITSQYNIEQIVAKIHKELL